MREIILSYGGQCQLFKHKISAGHLHNTRNLNQELRMKQTTITRELRSRAIQLSTVVQATYNKPSWFYPTHLPRIFGICSTLHFHYVILTTKSKTYHGSDQTSSHSTKTQREWNVWSRGANRECNWSVIDPNAHTTCSFLLIPSIWQMSGTVSSSINLFAFFFSSKVMSC